MIYANGKRGKSKKELRLSIDVFMEALVFHVWEDGKITHTFYADEIFANGCINNAQVYLRQLAYQKERMKDKPHCRTDFSSEGKPLIDVL